MRFRGCLFGDEIYFMRWTVFYCSMAERTLRRLWAETQAEARLRGLMRGGWRYRGFWRSHTLSMGGLDVYPTSVVEIGMEFLPIF